MQVSPSAFINLLCNHIPRHSHRMEMGQKQATCLQKQPACLTWVSAPHCDSCLGTWFLLETLWGKIQVGAQGYSQCYAREGKAWRSGCCWAICWEGVEGKTVTGGTGNPRIPEMLRKWGSWNLNGAALKLPYQWCNVIGLQCRPGDIYVYNTLFFRAILDLYQNWTYGKKSSYISAHSFSSTSIIH